MTKDLSELVFASRSGHLEEGHYALSRKLSGPRERAPLTLLH